MKRAEAKIELLNKGFIKIKNEYSEGYFRLIQANENTLGKNTEKLLKQLKIGGKMVIPLGKTDEQVLFRLTKISPTEFEKENLEPINLCRCWEILIINYHYLKSGGYSPPLEGCLQQS